MPHWLYSHLPDAAPPGTSNPAYRLDGTPHDYQPGDDDPEPAPNAEES